MDENYHAGHRKRVREKVLSGGISEFKDHEVLEFLLFYAIPRRNTNLIAHKIDDHFKTLNALSQASIDEICKVSGISPKSAAFIKYLPQISEFIFTDDALLNYRQPLGNSVEVTEYLRKEFAGADKSIVKLCCLTRSLHLICTTNVFDGVVTSSPDFMRKMVSIIIDNRCRDVIIACNHPDNTFIPTRNELDSISRISGLLRSLDIRLVDFVIVSKDGIPLSLSDSGYLSNLKLIMK